MFNKVKIIVLAIAAIAIFLLSDACSSLHPKRNDYTLPEHRLENQNWETLFTQDVAIDSFKVLNTGAVRVPLDGMLNIDKLAPDHGMDNLLWVEVYAFLFHHKEKGWFMIDSGLDSSFQKKGNIWGALAGKFIKATRQEKGQNIGAHLAREKKEIQGLFLTHLHGDHTSGLPEIDKSIPKYIGKWEKHFNIPLLYRSNHLSDSDTLIQLDWEKGITKTPFTSVLDIFGDASFLGIHTPGHSNSHMSYLLNTTEGPILLTGDASHTKYGFQNQIEPGWVVDQQQAENSLAQLTQFSAQYPKVKVIYGHQR